METINSAFSAQIYSCEFCLIKCSKKNDWERHILTAKHLRKCGFQKMETKNSAENDFICKCGKKYSTKSGIWKHRKVCAELCNDICNDSAELCNDICNDICNDSAELYNGTHLMNIIIKDNSDFKNLILEVVKNNTDLQKQNQGFQEKMLEMYKNTGNSNVNNINSHNKTFNMQFFLNEQCKDAMNITEFMDSFQLQFADLERIGEIGYVDGISELIIKKLNEIDIYKRPIHCSDTKRDVMYVRAENVWEKETNGHSRLRLFIKQITHKNIKLIPLWAATHPQAKDNQHPLNDTYLGMVGQAMGGRGDLEENENKIIKRIAKTVYIDKY